MAAPAAPTILGFSPEQNASLQEWVMGIINDRMQLADIVVSFVNDLQACRECLAFRNNMQERLAF